MTILSAALSIVWMTGFWMLSRNTAASVVTTLTAAIASLLAVGLAAGNIWSQLQLGYPQDSYWSLGWVGRAGVVAISMIGIAVFFLGIAAKTRLLLRIIPQANPGLVALVDIAAGQLAFAMLISLAPQAYYTLYRLIIPGLPQQWVVKGWIDTDRLKVIAELQANGSMSDHLAGLTLWAVIPFTLWVHRRIRRRKRAQETPI